MVLVSLLVNQLSGLFLIFFGRPKKNCPVSGNFWSVSGNFWSTKFLFGIPKFFLVDQIFFWLTKNSQRLTKNSLRLDNFFFGRPKKMRKRPNNWLTKRLTKTTWMGLSSILRCLDLIFLKNKLILSDEPSLINLTLFNLMLGEP